MSRIDTAPITLSSSLPRYATPMSSCTVVSLQAHHGSWSVWIGAVAWKLLSAGGFKWCASTPPRPASTDACARRGVSPCLVKMASGTADSAPSGRVKLEATSANSSGVGFC
eukprot:7381993-Prymnesium_polylepis.2